LNKRLTFEAFYPHSPERVWQAITDSASLEEWLLPANFEAKIGFRFQFQNLGRGKQTTVAGEVLQADEPKILSYTWDDGEAGAPSVVTWRLKPKDGGTLVQLEHAPEPEVKPIVLIEANMNWRYLLRVGLPGILAMRRPVPIVYDTPKPKGQEPERKAGFRWEETACK
jgi:uncharacterized protein YndB with AHSA1/START domain